MWAQEVAGVGKAICIPVWNGAGTVKVICIDEDGNPISEEIRQTVEAHIEAVRPIGGTLTVAAATAVPITVQAIITGNYQQSVLEDAIKTYLKTLAMTDTVVSPAKIGYLILSVDGISDYQSLTLNGTTDAVAITYDEVPVLEGVTNLA
jgi:uncharacterized phage protein gp47/JayE